MCALENMWLEAHGDEIETVHVEGRYRAAITIEGKPYMVEAKTEREALTRLYTLVVVHRGLRGLSM